MVGQGRAGEAVPPRDHDPTPVGMALEDDRRRAYEPSAPSGRTQCRYPSKWLTEQADATKSGCCAEKSRTSTDQGNSRAAQLVMGAPPVRPTLATFCASPRGPTLCRGRGLSDTRSGRIPIGLSVEPPLPKDDYRKVKDLQAELPVPLVFPRRATNAEMMRKIWRAILRANLAVFDISGGNANRFRDRACRREAQAVHDAVSERGRKIPGSSDPYSERMEYPRDSEGSSTPVRDYPLHGLQLVRDIATARVR
jgi:hypothetical protein